MDEDTLDLQEAVTTAQEMREFIKSPMGEKFYALMKDQYEALVVLACKESKYVASLQAMENLAAHIGGTLSRGTAALERLERFKTESPVEEW